MSRQSDAIRDYIATHTIKQKDIAEALGVSESTLSSILAGRYNISKANASKLANLYGFSLRFLLTGEGEPFPASRVVSAPVSGIVTQGDNSPVNTDAVNASLRAENERLRNEVEWLRGQLAKKQ